MFLVFSAKRKLASKGGKDGIAGGNSLEMAAVQNTSVGNVSNPAVEMA